eukprot:gene5587-7136_t
MHGRAYFGRFEVAGRDDYSDAERQHLASLAALAASVLATTTATPSASTWPAWPRWRP